MSSIHNTFSKILFKPSTVRGLKRGGGRVENLTIAGSELFESEGTHHLSGTFRYDPPGTPFKSVQQLNLDFSSFENHVFFNSAEAKTQASFEKIINQFPFDGTKKEYLRFLDGVGGFDKYVFDSFPKNIGYLNFSGSSEAAGSVGTYLSVSDFAGVADLNILKGSGQSVLDPTGSPFTVEFHLFVPSGSTNGNEIIFQRVGHEDSNTSKPISGVTVALSASDAGDSPLGECQVQAILSSGSFAVRTGAIIKKGKFNHLAIVFGQDDIDRIQIYNNGILTASSPVGTFDAGVVAGIPITIGSGSLHEIPNYSFLPSRTLSGSLDELRFFHSARTEKQIKHFAFKNIHNIADLKLYFRFNEPSGSFTVGSRTGNESLVLDYSGNSYHTAISNFDMSFRNSGSYMPTTAGWKLLKPPMHEEFIEKNPILFPSYEDVVSLCEDLLVSASQYDFNNPNLITKMVPPHYFHEASEFEGFELEKGDIGETYTYFADRPGGGKAGAPQILAAFLYLMAAEMDDLKLFISEFSSLIKISYEDQGTISDHFLPFLSKYYGLNLPTTFGQATLNQLHDAEGLNMNNVRASQGLQKIQNVIWRRILSDLPEIMQSRGTRHSIEVILRNIGINPSGLFRIREYGGSRRRKINDTFEKRHEIAAMLDFSGSLGIAGTVNTNGFDSARPLLRGHSLRTTRVEPGIPTIQGSWTTTGSSSVNDGLLTSGSWTVEGVFKFEGGVVGAEDPGPHPVKQSLFRLHTTGGQADGSPNNFIIFNTIAYAPIDSTSATGSIKLYGRPLSGSTAPVINLNLTGVNVFSGDKWHVEFGRTRNDFAGSISSSSYFLRAGRMSAGRLAEYDATAELFLDIGDSTLNYITSSNNASGTFLVVGSQSLSYDSSSDFGHLNSHSESDAQYVQFSGKTSGIRFYSKALTEKETLIHVKNFKSLGVEDPKVNFNFNSVDSGSFEKLRVDLSLDQPITASDSSGNIRLFDFSQNLFHASGSGFESSKSIIKPERFDYEILSPRFELAVATNKVRIRSFSQLSNIKKHGGSLAPLYEIPQRDQAKDDRRLSVDVSIVQAVNEDIVNIFATLDAFDDALGAPELVFSQEYGELRHLRRIYFQRLEGNIAFEKFFRFYKWFDDTVGDILEELLPSSTNFLGTNFIVESHLLERAKLVYNYSDMYVGETDRLEAGTIYMQQFLGDIRKF